MSNGSKTPPIPTPQDVALENGSSHAGHDMPSLPVIDEESGLPLYSPRPPWFNWLLAFPRAKDPNEPVRKLEIRPVSKEEFVKWGTEEAARIRARRGK